MNREACDEQIGCVLPREEKDVNNNSVCYWILTVNDKEQQLATTLREYLEIV